MSSSTFSRSVQMPRCVVNFCESTATAPHDRVIAARRSARSSVAVLGRLICSSDGGNILLELVLGPSMRLIDGVECHARR
jgi:hypothetical protein